MKKALTLLLALALVFCFASCGTSKSESVESVVKNAIKATVECDYEKIEKYYYDPILTKEGMDYLPEDFVKSMKLYISKLSAGEITVIDNEDGTKTAVFDVTVPDFYKLVELLYSEMIKKMDGMSESEMTEESIAELQKYSYTLLNGVLEGDEPPTKTSNIAIGLEEIDGEWMITEYDDLYDQLLADLEQVLAYIQY